MCSMFDNCSVLEHENQICVLSHRWANARWPKHPASGAWPRKGLRSAARDGHRTEIRRLYVPPAAEDEAARLLVTRCNRTSWALAATPTIAQEVLRLSSRRAGRR